MARPSLTKLAKPKGDSVAESTNRIDVFSKAMGEAEGKKVQRSREGMVKVTIHMNSEARTALKILAMKEGEGLEEFVLKSLNQRLESMDADFAIS